MGEVAGAATPNTIKIQTISKRIHTKGEVAGAATTNTEAGAAGGEPGRKKR